MGGPPINFAHTASCGPIQFDTATINVNEVGQFPTRGNCDRRRVDGIVGTMESVNPRYEYLATLEAVVEQGYFKPEKMARRNDRRVAR